MNLSPEDKPAAGFLDYPESVLVDMARTQMRGEVAEYYQLDPEVFGEDNDWLKKTDTHSYMLVASWWVCTFCHAAEQYCECDGILDELTRPEEVDADGIEFGGADPLFEDWDWGL